MGTATRRYLPLTLGLVLLGALVPLGSPSRAIAAGSVSLSAATVAYDQDFDTLAISGTGNGTLPIGWWLSESGSSSRNDGGYAAGTGSSNAGDTYSFGSASSTERAFGGLLSGSLNPTIGASLTNDTGETITSLTIEYACEMWRAGVANRGAADRLDFGYSIDATSLTSGSWNAVDALDCHSSNTSTSSGAKDGNDAANRSAVEATIGGLSIAEGATLWIRWTDFNIGSSDDGLAVDDFSLTPNPATSTDPTGLGGADPDTVPAGGSTLLTVAVTPGSNPPSSDLAVTADLTDIGGSSTQPFVDDGSSGDAAADDSVFSFAATVAGSTSTGSKSLPFTVSDAESRSSGGIIELEVVEPCGNPYTPIHQIQGSGATTTLSGTHSTEGIVIGDYQGGSATLRGFFIQDAAGDGDHTTSDGLFVFNGGPTQTLAVGDHVRVRGRVSDFQGQTQVSMSTVIVCSSDNDVAPTDVAFPVPAAAGGVDYLERVEGMLVNLRQTMYVTEHFQLGRFGQVTMSSGDRLRQPTAVTDPGAPANALQAANNLNKIVVDDDLQTQNPDPIEFGRGGQPLSASNTLRGGDSATGITGVMTWTWAGNFGSSSITTWRIRPNTALDGGIPQFQPTNPRPAAPEAVGGTVAVGSLNVLNYFNTFGSTSGVPNCTGGVGGDPVDCRGADSAAEFARQWPKTVEAILGMDVAVLGLMEIENDGYGPDSAIAHLVDRLNDATAPGTWAFIDADAETGEINALGADAIKVALIYQPGLVTPVGMTAALNTVAFVNGGDSEPRNRPSLAQAFSVNGLGDVFVVDVNHLKSKGGACTTPDAGDGQGNCNDVRTFAAGLLADWLASDPTATGTPDVIITGDLNAYAMEDPIGVLEDAGYANLVRAFGGDEAYSYVFDAQWGYLDHALGSPSLSGRVTGVTEWHINADEPPVLDYNTNFQSAGQQASLYAPDQYRMSDHDPVIVGLDFSLAGDKRALIGSLQALLPTGNAQADKRISDAIARLEESLRPAWWSSGDALDPKHGQKVFDQERKAVEQLTNEQLAGNAAVAAVVERILDVDRALAANAIDAAAAGDGEAKRLARAEQALARGDDERAAGRYGDAVGSYKQAWQEAIKALE